MPIEKAPGTGRVLVLPIGGRVDKTLTASAVTQIGGNVERIGCVPFAHRQVDLWRSHGSVFIGKWCCKGEHAKSDRGSQSRKRPHVPNSFTSAPG